MLFYLNLFCKLCLIPQLSAYHQKLRKMPNCHLLYKVFYQIIVVRIAYIHAMILSNSNRLSAIKPELTVYIILVSFFSYELFKVLYQIRKFATKKKKQRPFSNVPFSVPSPHWLYGHMRHVGTLSGQEYLTLRHADPVSGVSTFWGMNSPVLSVLKGEHVREVYCHSPHRKEIPIISKHFKMALGYKSLAMLQGKEWNNSRKIASHSILNGALLLTAEASHKVINRTLSIIRNKIREEVPNPYKQRSATIDIRELSTKLTLDVFGICFLGCDFGCTDTDNRNKNKMYFEKFQFLLDELHCRCYESNSLILNYFYCLPTKRNRSFHAAKRSVQELIMESVTTKPCSSSSSLSENDSNSCKKSKHAIKIMYDEGLRDDYLIDAVLTFWYGGFDTTSIAVSYCLYNVAIRSHIQKECALEIAQQLPNGLTKPTDSLAQLLPYCNAVLMESLRLFPSGPNTARNLSRKLIIPERKLSFEKDTRVFISIWSIHRYEGNFHRALEFLPRRWVRKVREKDLDTYSWVQRSAKDIDSEEEKSEHDYCHSANKNNFFAFSAGKRYCLGEKIAMLEALTIFVRILMNFEIELVDGYEVEPIKTGLVQSPKDGMPLIFRER